MYHHVWCFKCTFCCWKMAVCVNFKEWNEEKRLKRVPECIWIEIKCKIHVHLLLETKRHALKPEIYELLGYFLEHAKMKSQETDFQELWKTAAPRFNVPLTRHEMMLRKQRYRRCLPLVILDVLKQRYKWTVKLRRSSKLDQVKFIASEVKMI